MILSSRPKFIVVEGPDGVGKSSLVTSLAERLDYLSLKTPPEEFRKLRSHFDGQNADPMSRFLFYASGFRFPKIINLFSDTPKAVFPFSVFPIAYNEA